MKLAAIALVAGLAAAGAAQADVVSSQEGGAVIRETFTVHAPAARVFEAMIHPGPWWNAGHTFSRNAANLYVDTGANGCLCEHLPGGGFVRHLNVVYFAPGQEIRFEGGMGPMQTTGTSGHMSWAVSEAAGVTTVTWTYAVGGYFPGGFVAFAPRIDGMLGEQTSRLKTFLETGHVPPSS
jgi:hypothetical protein